MYCTVVYTSIHTTIRYFLSLSHFFLPSFWLVLVRICVRKCVRLASKLAHLAWLTSVVSLGDSKVFSYAPLFPQTNYICAIETHLKALLSSSSFFFQFHSIRFAFVLFLRVPRTHSFFWQNFFIFKNLWRRGDQSHLKRRKAYCILYV